MFQEDYYATVQLLESMTNVPKMKFHAYAYEHLSKRAWHWWNEEKEKEWLQENKTNKTPVTTNVGKY